MDTLGFAGAAPKIRDQSPQQNFLKQSTVMLLGGMPVIDWMSELFALVSLVFFLASMRLMGTSSLPITMFDKVASAMESSMMAGGGTS